MDYSELQHLQNTMADKKEPEPKQPEPDTPQKAEKPKEKKQIFNQPTPPPYNTAENDTSIQPHSTRKQEPDTPKPEQATTAPPTKFMSYDALLALAKKEKPERYTTRLTPSLEIAVEKYAYEHDTDHYKVVKQAVVEFLTCKT